MARHDAISQDTDRQIRRLLLNGTSVPRTAKMVGVSQSAVHRRKAKLVASGVNFGLCECGRPRSHKGMCSARVKRSKKPPEVIEIHSRVQVNSTYRIHLTRLKLIAFPDVGNAMQVWDYVRRAIPVSFPTDVRDDLIQELALAVLDGSLRKENLDQAFPQVIRSFFQSNYEPYDVVRVSAWDDDGDEWTSTYAQYDPSNDILESAWEGYVSSESSLMTGDRPGINMERRREVRSEYMPIFEREDMER